MRRLVSALLFLTGCAGIFMDVETLRAQGYQPTGTVYQTVTGEVRKAPFELWWKETRDPERRLHFCLVPGPEIVAAGYNWGIS